MNPAWWVAPYKPSFEEVKDRHRKQLAAPQGRKRHHRQLVGVDPSRGATYEPSFEEVKDRHRKQLATPEVRKVAYEVTQ